MCGVLFNSYFSCRALQVAEENRTRDEKMFAIDYEDSLSIRARFSLAGPHILFAWDIPEHNTSISKIGVAVELTVANNCRRTQVLTGRSYEQKPSKVMNLLRSIHNEALVSSSMGSKSETIRLPALQLNNFLWSGTNARFEQLGTGSSYEIGPEQSVVCHDTIEVIVPFKFRESHLRDFFEGNLANWFTAKKDAPLQEWIKLLAIGSASGEPNPQEIAMRRQSQMLENITVTVHSIRDREWSVVCPLEPE